MRSLSRLGFAFFLLLALVACESIGYYSQAARGQLQQIVSSREIAGLLEDESLAPAVREKLELILSLREFARDSMQLPAENSYLRYFELDRDYLVWNVFAAPALSMQAVNWCYPIAGCVGYRGYFSEQDALNKAEALAGEGYDVYVGGVDAYSTLGWFSDPVNSAFIRRSEAQLASLIAHELAHQKIYVPGDTVFNESFASFVGQEALRRWAESQGRPELLLQAAEDQRIQDGFVSLVLAYSDSLAALYDSGADEGEMLREKLRLQARLREEYESLREQWGDTRYDRWFAGPLNNAQLGTVSAYNTLVPAFRTILQRCKGNLDCFYERVEALAELPAGQRSAGLDELMPAA